MTTRSRLGPIVDEPRKKYRVKIAPGVDKLSFKRVLQWSPAESYYVPIYETVTIPNGEVIDYFLTEDSEHNPVHLFARQFDDRLFTLDQAVVDGALLEPDKGNTQHFWLQEI